ncbi:MAG: hypothetical protein ACI970_000733, partial [Myxococcota bacterium]
MLPDGEARRGSRGEVGGLGRHDHGDGGVQQLVQALLHDHLHRRAQQLLDQRTVGSERSSHSAHPQDTRIASRDGGW